MINYSMEMSNSAIVKSVAAENVFPLTNAENEVYEALNRSISINGRQVPHDFGDSLSFVSEDGSVWQVKPGNPQKGGNGKVQKYLGVSGQSTGFYLPSVPSAFRTQIKSDISTVGSFWDAVEMDSSISIVVTEGAKKALSLLSVGVAAVAVSGVDGSTVKDEEGVSILDPNFSRFLVPGRVVTIAFDQDSSKKTKASVERAKLGLASRIQAFEEGVILRDCTWSEKLGKGIDDVSATAGSATVLGLIDKATAVVLMGGCLQPRNKYSVYRNGAKGPVLKAANEIADAIIGLFGGSGVSFDERGRVSERVCRYSFDAVLGCFFGYGVEQDGLWSVVSATGFGAMVDAIITKSLDGSGLGYSDSLVNSVVNLLKLRLGKKVAKTSLTAKLLPMRNGVLDTRTMTLGEHNPEYGFRWQLPYAYDANLPAPQPIIDFLMSSQEGSEVRVALLRAYLKAIVTGRTDLQKFMEIVGKGGTGKSTFGNLATALVGEENTVTMTLSQLSAQFSIADMMGKKLIYLPDADSYTDSLASLKQITGGDRIKAELKNIQEKVEFYISGMVLIAGNKPLIDKADSGIHRRRITIAFNNVVGETSQRNLLTRDQGEFSGEFVQYLPALLNWVLAMPDEDMTDLLKSGSYLPELIQSALEAALETSPMAAWIDQFLVFDVLEAAPMGRLVKLTKDGQTTYRDSDILLYASYAQFCLETGSKPVSLKAFGSDLINVSLATFGQTLTRAKKSSGTVIVGCRVKKVFEMLEEVLSTPEVAEVAVVAEVVAEVAEVVAEVAVVAEVVAVVTGRSTASKAPKRKTPEIVEEAPIVEFEFEFAFDEAS